MPFEIHGDEPLDSFVNVRVTYKEKLKIKEDSELAGMTVSAIVRRRYFGRPIVVNSDLVMIRELRRLGGLLKHIHNESNGAYSKDTAQMLVVLKEYIVKLSQSVVELDEHSDSKKN